MVTQDTFFRQIWCQQLFTQLINIQYVMLYMSFHIKRHKVTII
jgi:hypothetical protein